MISGLKALVVEDEAVIAMALEDILESLGFGAVTMATNLERGLELVSGQTFDVAVLDINLNGVASFPLADVLRAAGTPYAFATGYGEAGRLARHCGVPVIHKPYTSDDVGECLRELLRREIA